MTAAAAIITESCLLCTEEPVSLSSVTAVVIFVSKFKKKKKEREERKV